MSEGHLGLDCTAPFPAQLAPGHGPVHALSNFLSLSTHLLRVQRCLQGRHIARAGLDNMWYVFTPLLRHEELERATERCDSSTVRLSLLM